MTVRVEPRKGESLAEVLTRFNKAVNLRYRMGWAKRRYAFFEKTSVLRRRKRILDEIGRRNNSSFGRRVEFEELFGR